jgi:predicted DCC family thiol-disulfide oxidoreductase YuxK
MKVARVPARSLVIFDGHCNFCRFWVERCRQIGGEPMDFIESQKAAADYPEIPQTAFDRAVVFIEKDGAVIEAGDAMMRIMRTSPRWGWLAALIMAVAPLRAIMRWSYRRIAAKREFFSALTRWSWGPDPAPSTYAVSRRFFAHGLGVVFFCAFASLLVQVRALIGAQGIQPAAELLKASHEKLGARAFWEFPTLLWAGASDAALISFGVSGLLVSIVLAVGRAPGLCALLLWLIYLSVAAVAAPFFDLPLDRLLLETALASTLLLPWRILPVWRLTTRLNTLGRWFLGWLLLRFVFEAGVQKFTGGDPSARGFAFMDHYYEAQLLPAWTSWWMHQLPGWFHKIEAALALAIELLAPLTLFLPRRIRHLGAYAIIAQAVALFLTGNHGFLPLLTIVLALLWFDDLHWPERLRLRLVRRARPPIHLDNPGWPNYILEPVAGVAFFLTALLFATNLWPRFYWPVPVRILYTALAPLRSLNLYGPAYAPRAVRPELLIEGSDNGSSWEGFEFWYKPGNPWEPPALAFLHQPRLDAVLARAARSPLDEKREAAGLRHVVAPFLQASPQALELLRWNPFKGHPPTWIRGMLYQYRFTRLGEGRAYWDREVKDLYFKPVTLKKDAADAP